MLTRFSPLDKDQIIEFEKLYFQTYVKVYESEEIKFIPRNSNNIANVVPLTFVFVKYIEELKHLCNQHLKLLGNIKSHVSHNNNYVFLNKRTFKVQF